MNGQFRTSPLTSVVTFWSTDGFKLLRSFTRVDDQPRALALAPDGSRYVCVLGSVAMAFDAVTGKPLWERDLADTPESRRFIHLSHYGFRFSPDGTRIAAWNTAHSLEPGTVHLLDAASGSRIARFVPSKPAESPYLLGAAFSPDAKRLTIGYPDGVLVTETDRAAADGTLAATPLKSLDLADAGRFAVSPDGRTLLLGGIPAKGSPLRVVNAADQTARDPSPGTGVKPVESAIPDLGRTHPPDHVSSHSIIKLMSGRYLLWEKQDNVALLNKSNRGMAVQMAEKDYLQLFGRGRVLSFAYTPDEQTLFTRGESAKDLGPVPDDPRIRFWDVSTGKEWADVPGPTAAQLGSVRAIAVSPDGRSMTAKHPDGGLWVWETATAKPRFRLDTGGPADVYRFGFALDGLRFHSNGYDRGDRLEWDLFAIAEAAELTDADRAALWADLASDDAAKAFRAIVRFARDPERSVPFLKESARKLPAVTDPARLAARPFDKDIVTARRAVEALEKCGTPAAAAALADLGEHLPYAVPQAAAARLAPTK